MADLTGHWRQEFDNKYLGAWNLWDKDRNTYRTASVTIRDIRIEPVTRQGGKTERLPVVYFEGKRVPMVMSKTMGKVVEQMYGLAMAGWIGKKITLYVERGVKVRSGKGDVLRIKNDRAGSELREELQEVVPPEQFGEEEIEDGKVKP